METGLAIQASLQYMQIKDASIKHIFRIAVLLKVPLYLAACYLVDYGAKHSALHLFLCELMHLGQSLRPLRGLPGR